MPVWVVAANIISLFGSVLLIAAGLSKKNKATVIYQTCQVCLAAIANIILGAYTGSTLNMLSVARNGIVIKDKYNNRWRTFFVAVNIASGYLLRKPGYLWLLIVFGNSLFTIMLGRDFYKVNNPDP